MELSGFIYLFFRLAPFILVCYFTLSSIFNADFKGIIFLVGLIFACFITLMIGQFFSSPKMENIPAECNSITLNGLIGWSKLPFSPTILGFTFFYILWWIISPAGIKKDEITTSLVAYNLPIIVFFPIIIIADLLINYQLKCYPMDTTATTNLSGQGLIAYLGNLFYNSNFVRPFYSLAIGIGSGIGYAELIKSTGSADLQWFSSSIANEVCSRPAKSTFKCSVYKGGEKVASTNV